MIGLGRMGSNMVQRLVNGGHQCVVYDHDPAVAEALSSDAVRPASDLPSLVDAMDTPRHIWMMVPAAAVDSVIDELSPLLDAGDTLVDGGNSRYHDDIHRAKRLTEAGINYLDVGTSGGVYGLERGYSMMIGGPEESVAQLRPIFETLAPGMGDVPRTEGRSEETSAEHGWLHCGPTGAGHFVKMVHNGIEYGMMAAYAEGLNILVEANVGKKAREIDAETTPLENPEYYQYDLDIAEITEVWRRGSVIASWLLDLTAHALLNDPALENFGGKVSDSGEGRWTLSAAIDEGVPAPVLSAALFSRFSSRGNDNYANRVLSAMRHEFGGHKEKAGGD